jgi:hypothetical protein
MLLSEASANLKIAASPIFLGSFLPAHGAINDLDVRGYPGCCALLDATFISSVRRSYGRGPSLSSLPAEGDGKKQESVKRAVRTCDR